MRKSNFYFKNLLTLVCFLLFLFLLPAAKVKGEEKSYFKKSNSNQVKIAVLLDLSGKWKQWGKQEERGIKFALEKSSLKVSYFDTKGDNSETQKLLSAIKSEGYRY
ncbi:MAG: hypothetical protein D6780_08420, partial [Candidatus Dadabacteria bacterium]